MKYTVPVLVVLVILLASALAYLAGQKNSPAPAPSATGGVEGSPAPKACTLDGKVCEDGSTVGRTGPNCEFAPCPSPAPLQTIKGGGILSFPRYEVLIPNNWTWSREAQGADNEKIILKKGDSGISISQGGFGGAMCLYPEDPDVEGPAGRYTQYVEITTRSGDKLRRSTPEAGKGFGLCHLTAYGWGTPTVYGHISLTTPSSPTPADLQIIDDILKSFQKI